MTSLAQAVEDIGDALDARDLDLAHDLFDRAAQGRQERMEALVQALAADVTIPIGAVIVDFGIDVWNNPHRTGFAWRCGDCPWTGSNYTTEHAARAAAEEHARGHRSVPRVGTFNEINA
ncbi:hypothetical protein [Streptosporangium saharense]|uniref:hypothetical protein n=1 Tax=Streptosporangium saharense TaxID=1706840 RepID=UPI00332B0915